MKDKKHIPRANSALFTLELHDMAFSIVGNHPLMTIDDVIDNYCIGWCHSNDTAVPDNGKAIALMFEDEVGEKSWFHYYLSILRKEYVFDGYDL